MYIINRRIENVMECVQSVVMHISDIYLKITHNLYFNNEIVFYYS